MPFGRRLAITTWLACATLAVAAEDLDALLKKATDGTKTPAIAVLVIRDGQFELPDPRTTRHRRAHRGGGGEARCLARGG